MDTLRYGVFKLGQLWTVTDPGGARLGFVSREMAVAALQTMIAVHGVTPGLVVVVLQGCDGQLRTLIDPGDDLVWRDEAKNAAWDAVFALPDPKPPFLHPANDSAANEGERDG